MQRIKDEKRKSLESIINELKITGMIPLQNTNIPIRLKRNEKVHLLAGRTINRVMSIALTITNQRLFFVGTEYLLRTYMQFKDNMIITPGIKAITLSSIIAIDIPKHNGDYKQWESIIHLEKGKRLSIKFSSCQGARLFYAILTEMVDRMNDPHIPREIRIVSSVSSLNNKKLSI